MVCKTDSTLRSHDACVLQDAIRGFWCCDRPDCSYREFPQERKQTPQVALEISSPTMFMVSTCAFASSSGCMASRAAW